VYRPAWEQFGNYVPTVLPERYDAFIEEFSTILQRHATRSAQGA